jgi:hypothetical protein
MMGAGLSRQPCCIRPRPSGLIEPCRPTPRFKPHVGEGWLHELNYTDIACSRGAQSPASS